MVLTAASAGCAAGSSEVDPAVPPSSAAGGTGGGAGGAGGSATSSPGGAGGVAATGGGAGGAAGTGSGGATGPAPQAGTSGSHSPDAGADAGDTATAGDLPAETTGPFTCTLVLGIKQTGEWFNAGFESVVPNERWEVVPVHNGHLELWADPKNVIWSTKVGSPCAKDATSPDRVIFVGTNYDYTTTEEFVPRLTAVVENIKARYSAVKRIELMTHIRAPGNVPCPGNLGFKTHIKPAQDESIDLVATRYPGLVVASPRFEVAACSDYDLYPHFSGAPAMAIARKIGEHYRDR